MEAIILTGGFGTRLQPIVKDVPKPMADINGKPFLSYLMEYLSGQETSRVLLSVGYKHEIIKNHFGLRYGDIEIAYIVEDTPLGTGGAIREALKHTHGHEVIVLNGDSFFNVDLKELIDFHHTLDSLLTMAVKPMHNFDRYGTVVLRGSRIIAFEEKSFKPFGYINGGVYVMNTDIFETVRFMGDVFSFELDFLCKNIGDLQVHAFICDNYFIDIGIPEDYERAQQELKQFTEGSPDDYFTNTA